ncbi:unnamed protein product [Coffea canephora]|uniref:Uncharacterized protein n=1 Tax=Coffea canephora TaxID=49390 RepID=A0A068TM45_COFCA|nr:unnamed protein product [Coffea canephora]
MEMQLVISFFATAFCTVGMLINHDFAAIAREARELKIPCNAGIKGIFCGNSSSWGPLESLFLSQHCSLVS